MNRGIILIFLLSGICFAGGLYYKVTGIEDDDTLSVRQSASASSKKTGTLLSYDTGITVGKCKKNGSTVWCHIDFLPDDTMFFVRDFPRNGGWVNKKYLKPASDIIYSPAIQYRKNQNIFKVVGVRSDDNLNVREHPRNSSKKVGHLKYNDVGIVAAKCQKIGKSSWCYVAYDFTMGWAMGPESSKVPYAVLGWVNMRYLKLDDNIKNHRLPEMTFPGEGY
ncbi:hypothetical protein [Sulfurovum sp. NBC37-1]|uniref:hypothetical protein n=1 Tax=Sulfurovum sp. (strain NBC37-1) TaxID=387093 RepID=UPI00015879B6|nr:hypothetical protein [Sulfurovum sp. NBC37-1]BAF72968.1 hypothetical protein SUN_2026 [Sulfurovum sp. NBC37-1]